jgi:hypothetical protein
VQQDVRPLCSPREGLQCGASPTKYKREAAEATQNSRSSGVRRARPQGLSKERRTREGLKQKDELKADILAHAKSLKQRRTHTLKQHADKKRK